LPFLSSGEGHPLLADGTHPQGMVFAPGYLKLGPDVARFDRFKPSPDQLNSKI
jgi:hypothetical protein